LVANKVRSGYDEDFIQKNKPGIPLLATFPAETEVNEADHKGLSVYDHVDSLREAAKKAVIDLKDYTAK